MRRILIRGPCVLVDVAWFLLAALLSWHLWQHWPSQIRGTELYHVVVRGGDIVYEDYWTTSPPPPVHVRKLWFEYLNFTNENQH
jgi:hypothetical protein